MTEVNRGLDFRLRPFCDNACGRRVLHRHHHLCVECSAKKGLKTHLKQAQKDPCQFGAKDGVTRCGNAALKGKKLCKKHLLLTQRKDQQKFDYRKYYTSMPSVYQLVVGPTVSAYMNCVLEDAPKKQFELEEELKITRVCAAEFVGFYSDLKELINVYTEKTEKKPGPGASAEEVAEYEKNHQTLVNLQQQALKAASVVQESLLKVAALGEKAQAAYYKNADLLDVNQLPLIVNQLVQALFEVCGTENRHIAEQFQETVANKLRIPGYNLDDKGTTRRADLLLDEMAASIALDAQAVAEIRAQQPRLTDGSKK